ncbi:hypothetical protein JOQ06_006348 [Pogonophryne albipinna]|uniref:PH domain-containing protein n=1 Tax=Pogonophryne albipinna TaxID=1090488 RepID=A0AAD6FSI8_9TELE|nr:hypothetical protein JOQ06_006348 [Pogonophryne albipinna]
MASIMEGPLSKWTNVMKGWQYRWFVLDYNAGLLSYYTSKDKMMRGSRRGCVRLRGAVIGIDDEDDSTFTITVDQKTFHFQGLYLTFSTFISHPSICLHPLLHFPPSRGSPPATVHGPPAPPTSSMPSPMSVFRSCMLWFYKSKGKEESVHGAIACRCRRMEDEEELVCLLGH